MALLPPPPQLFLGPDGLPTQAWADYLLQLQQNVGASAPADAPFLVTQANATLTHEVNLGALATGYLRVRTALGIATITSAVAVATQASPADPTGTASLVGVMMGLAGTITPVFTGRVLVTVTGTIFNPTAIADGAQAQIRIGTGAVPTNGSALAGTAIGSAAKYTASTVAGKVPFALSALATGLTTSVALWIDVGLAALTGGTATITDISIAALEV
jgi:hypothetical protein